MPLGRSCVAIASVRGWSFVSRKSSHAREMAYRHAAPGEPNIGGAMAAARRLPEPSRFNADPCSPRLCGRNRSGVMGFSGLPHHVHVQVTEPPGRNEPCSGNVALETTQPALMDVDYRRLLRHFAWRRKPFDR